MVFLGYSAVFAFGPLALALVLVLQNVLHPWHWEPAQTSDVETNSESSGNFELEGQISFIRVVFGAVRAHVTCSNHPPCSSQA